MGEKFNWMVMPKSVAISTATPSRSFEYNLLNTTVLQILRYGEREYGINLQWNAIDPDTFHVRFARATGTTEPIRYREPIAIGIRSGGYLRYAEREYGVNLTWSDTPVFEWEFRDVANSNNTVDTNEKTGIFNKVSNDFLFYDPRRYGINLKWLRDEGKFNDAPWYIDAVSFVEGTASQALNAGKELGNRFLGTPDFFLSLLGVMMPKRLRLRIVILRDVNGSPLLDKKDVERALKYAKDVLQSKANTSVLPAWGQLIDTLDKPAPYFALNVHCDFAAEKEDFKRAGEYFRSHSVKNPAGLTSGYGEAITAFVVNDVKNKLGCSLGPLSNYITVEANAFKPTSGHASTLAHEIGHACGLWHRSLESNLMYPTTARGDGLNNRQIAVLRNSRHVTLL